MYSLNGINYDVRCNDLNDSSPLLSLDIIINKAICKSPIIQQSWASVLSQSTILGETKGRFLPDLSSSFSRQFSSTESLGINASQTSNLGNFGSINFQWRLFDFNTRKSYYDSESLQFTSIIYKHHDTVRGVIDSVIESYFILLNASANVHIRIQSVINAELIRDITLNRSKSGLTSLSEILQSDAAYVRSKIHLDRALLDESIARNNINRIIGVDLNIELPANIKNHLEDKFSFSNFDISLPDLLINHPLFKSSEYSLLASKERYLAITREHLPFVDLTAQFNNNMGPNQSLSSNKNTSYATGFTITIPLFKGYAPAYRSSRAQASILEKEAVFLDKKNQISFEISKLHLSLLSSYNNHLLSSNVINLGQSILESTRRKYSLGISDIHEIITVQSNLTDAEVDNFKNLIDYHSNKTRLSILFNSDFFSFN
jgi:outer membrane protein TolC